MAIAYDSISGTDVTATSATVSHTCTGSNLILFAFVSVDGGATVSTVTYNGVSMSLVNTQTNGGEIQALYYLAGPATGAHNIVFTPSGSANLQIRGISYTGASQTGIPDASLAQANASSTSLSHTLTSIADNCWHTMCARDGAAAVGAGAGTTLRTSGANNGCEFLDTNGAITPAGSNTIISTQSSPGYIRQNGCTFAPVATVVANHSNFFTFFN